MEFAATFTSEFGINAGFDVRAGAQVNPEDLFEGAEDRGLPNFNSLCEKVTVQDRYGK